MATVSKRAPAKTAPAKKAPAKKPGRVRIKDDAKIKLLVKENPRQPGSKRAQQFAKYKTGMTVAAAIKAGVPRGAIRRDMRRKLIAFA